MNMKTVSSSPFTFNQISSESGIEWTTSLGSFFERNNIVDKLHQITADSPFFQNKKNDAVIALNHILLPQHFAL